MCFQDLSMMLFVYTYSVEFDGCVVSMVGNHCPFSQGGTFNCLHLYSTVNNTAANILVHASCDISESVFGTCTQMQKSLPHFAEVLAACVPGWLTLSTLPPASPRGSHDWSHIPTKASSYPAFKVSPASLIIGAKWYCTIVFIWGEFEHLSISLLVFELLLSIVSSYPLLVFLLE